MESSQIEKMPKARVERLKGLIVQANRTCSLLDAMREFPISMDIWQQAIEQECARMARTAGIKKHVNGCSMRCGIACIEPRGEKVK